MNRRSRGWTTVVLVVGLLALVGGSALAGPLGAGTTGPSLTYSVALGIVNNTVRLGPSYLMTSPRVVSGPDYANGSVRAIYVLGVNYTGLSTCNALTAFASVDSGVSYSGPYYANLCLPNGELDAVVEPNGTIAVSVPGPGISLSYDGAARWTPLTMLGNATTPPALTEDPATGTLYLAWTAYSPGTLFVASSTDGGLSWSAPQSVLANGSGALYPEVAAFGGHVVVTYLAAGSGALGNAVASVASADGGQTWSAPLVLEPALTGVFPSGPSVAVSDTGTFASAWHLSSGTLNGGQVMVADSVDNGTTWSSAIPIGSPAPPQYSSEYSPHVAAFDASGRLYVTWHNYSANHPLNATLNVAVSGPSLAQFNTSSFTLEFQTAASNGTQYENLGMGPHGDVFLTWDVYGPPASPDYGIFVRSVTGEIAGTVAGAPSGTVVTVTDAATNATVATLPAGGPAMPRQSLSPHPYLVWVTSASGTVLAGSVPVVPWGLTTFTLRLGGTTTIPPSATVAPPPWLLFAVVGGAVALGGVMAAVVYTRVTPETALQQKVRLLVYEYVAQHPTASFSQIRDAVGLQNGTAAYHLGVLEKQGLIRSAHQGRRRLFVASGVPSVHAGLLVSELQNSIIRAVQATPGIGVREISRTVGKVPSSVSYNVRHLAHQGLLRTERQGARLRCFPIGLRGE